jgi:hypothetical protein
MKKVEAYQCSKCKKLFTTEERAKEHEDCCSAGEWCGLCVSKDDDQRWILSATRYNTVLDTSRDIWGGIEHNWYTYDQRESYIARFGIKFRYGTDPEQVKQELLTYAEPKIRKYLDDEKFEEFKKVLLSWDNTYNTGS